MQKLLNYKGYLWGWILNDGIRLNSGGTAIRDKIVGIWGKVFRSDIPNHFYCETFLPKQQNSTKKSSWTERPLTMLQNINREQCILFAYPENNPVANEIIIIPGLDAPKTMKQQSWKCKACGHTFYTPLSVIKKFMPKIKCDVCKKIAATKTGVITKEIQE